MIRGTGGWTLKNWWELIRDTFKKFFDEQPFRYCAAIAYYTIFSLPGIAILSVMVAGQFYEYETVRTELLNQIRLLIGNSSAEQVESLMEKAAISDEYFLMRIVGFVAIGISATTVFASLQDSINSIWKIRPKPERGWLKFIINRLLSLAMVACVGFFILVSLMVDTLLSILSETISGWLSEFSFYLVYVVNLIISLGIVVLVFGLIYKVLPDARLQWRHVWFGAMVTTLLFVGGKFLIGYYLSTSDVGSAYGAAGSLVVLLSWVYYSVLILLLGAQFTYVYNQKRGHKILPDKMAVAIRIEEIESEKESATEE